MAPQNLVRLEFSNYFSYEVHAKTLTGTVGAEQDSPKITLRGTLVYNPVRPSCLYTQDQERLTDAIQIRSLEKFNKHFWRNPS